MGKPSFKKYISAVMTTALVAVPTFQALADRTSNNLLTTAKSLSEQTSLQGINVKASSGKHEITLITGDVVTVTELAAGKSINNFEPADQVGGGARVLTSNKDTYVFPEQAMAYFGTIPSKIVHDFR